jgi:hypothetical protein
MNSGNSIVPPSPAVRGQIQKTYNDINVLAGFTDSNHLMQIVSEYYLTLTPTAQQLILQNAESSRQFVAKLPAITNFEVEVRPINNPYIQTIINDPIFQNSFGGNQYRFFYINPFNVIALQPWIEPRKDKVPNDELELLKFALPTSWDTPAEVNFVQPNGPIQILSSNPTLQGLSIEFDNINGRVMLGAPKHLNLIQVKQFQGKYYLLNGYHRVVDAIQQGLTEIPCIVVDAFSPGEFITAPNFFGFGYASALQRPPLVSDFMTTASIDTKARERRYGMIVSLDVKPINIGI